MTNEIKLKPCPFCGSKPSKRFVPGLCIIECSAQYPCCGCCGYAEEDATTEWNTRHIEITDEMVERAAKEIFPDNLGGGPWGHSPWEEAKKQARAALTAALKG